MAKAIFTHAEGSKYDDLPWERYHFPRTYLNVVQAALGDWAIYYEPRRDAASGRGRMAYYAAARVVRVRPDPALADHFYADMTGYVPFAAAVPFRTDGLYLESGLRKADGSTNKGAFGRNVRFIPDAEFETIVALGMAGLREELGAEDWTPQIDRAPRPMPSPSPRQEDGGRRWAEAPEPVLEAAEPPAEPFRRPLVERLTSRRLRDAAFARQVKSAYRETCAMTGLRILNGGGRPEVQAAHIRAVEQDGPDVLNNGVALSGTVHWMFDRGLLSIDDDYSILTARDSLPPGAEALLRPERRLLLPDHAPARPHPAYLKWHREAVFKG
ncbi:HNH endonuclease [uncultured Albimonas sp.]|uniref:HNH endonuclease n=1 Tax=uncultured Albimonas sp. TaxID=1331701 RepID=UPI0030EC69C4|tara:strand:- start:1013 stop:1993 length:981 start_codon:yes stop_codon:yes gene_type:complete